MSQTGNDTPVRLGPGQSLSRSIVFAVRSLVVFDKKSGDREMHRYLYIGAMAFVLFFIQGNLSINAQTSPPVTDELRATIAQTIGGQPESVELVANGSIFTVLRVNSNMSEATHAGRDNEANVIGQIVLKAMTGSPAYKKLHTIRVQYVTRPKPGAVQKVVDTIEFRKSPSGSFQFHTT